MKRFLILLSILCFGAYADTITINWGVDNKPYTTTTCEIDGDVILPPVSKRGHVFRGWQPEHFDRGTFADYVSVPNDVVYYHIDYHQTHKPQKGDYITIVDTSDYHGEPDNEMFIYKTSSMYGGSGPSTFSFVVNDVKTNCTKSSPVGTLSCSISNTGIYVYAGAQSSHSYVDLYFYTDAEHTRLISILYNGVLRDHVTMPWGGEAEAYVYYLDLSITYSGTWRFVYDGVWEIDGKNGWKPDVQISNE